MPKPSLITQQPTASSSLRQAKHLRREMTAAETRLWASLRASRLEGFHFRRQQVIAPYIIDFYCHTAALVVEIDGGVHQDQAEQDAARDRDLQSRGLRMLHFTNSEVNQNIEGVLAEILSACRDQTYKGQQNKNEG